MGSTWDADTPREREPRPGLAAACYFGLLLALNVKAGGYATQGVATIMVSGSTGGPTAGETVATRGSRR